MNNDLSLSTVDIFNNILHARNLTERLTSVAQLNTTITLLANNCISIGDGGELKIYTSPLNKATDNQPHRKLMILAMERIELRASFTFTAVNGKVVNFNIIPSTGECMYDGHYSTIGTLCNSLANFIIINS